MPTTTSYASLPTTMDAFTSFQEMETSDQLAALEYALSVNQNALVSQNNPQVAAQLYTLLTSLRAAQASSGITDLPNIPAEGELSTSDLITLLMTEMRKTKNAVMVSLGSDIVAKQKVTDAENATALKKLNESISKQAEADKMKKGLEIAKWCMLAVSILLIILSAIATVFTFGAGSVAIGLSVAALTVSVAMLCASSIPGKDGKTGMDKMSEKISEGIAKIDLNNRKEAAEKRLGKKWDEMSGEEQQEVIDAAEETGSNSAVGITISIQVIMAILVIALTLGAGAASAGSSVATTASSGSRTALESVKASAPAIAQTARLNSGVIQVAQGAGQVAASGMSIHVADLQLDATTAETEAEKTKAYVKYILRLIDDNEDFLRELLEMDANNAEQIKSILKNAHSSNMKIAQNYSFNA